MAYRANVAFRYYAPVLGGILPWLFRSRELGNFTYELTERNLSYLASTLAFVAGAVDDEIASLLAEPQRDQKLRVHIQETVKASPYRAVTDPVPLFGKRLGWYALARLLKPAVIVETGVDKGLGSVLLCSALLRNIKEGHDGAYYGTDIDPEAGWLLHGEYAKVGRVLYGDSIESLNALQPRIDLFINDSDHSPNYELAEYRAVAAKLSERSLILSDNAHCSMALWTFSRESNRRFVFFAEEPRNHWYPGGGIGISLAPRFMEPKVPGETALCVPANMPERRTEGIAVAFETPSSDQVSPGLVLD